MSPQIWRFIFVISLTHALVHTYELAWPSIEQEATTGLFPHDAIRGKKVSGWLAGIWRMLFGGGSLLVGVLMTQKSATKWLILYLVGCAGCSVMAGLSSNLVGLGISLAGMGAFASIYHPAGLSIISFRTTPEQRPMALGIHGILGSLGIAVAPLWAAIWIGSGGDWRTYLIGLAVPGLMLAFIVYRERGQEPEVNETESSNDGEQAMQFLMLVLIGSIAAVQGFVYSAQLSFLPRYLSEISGFTDVSIPGDVLGVQGKFLAAAALLVGCLGQFISGCVARHQHLEKQLIVILLLNVPFLMWMAFATPGWRVYAAGGFALVHFMYQPVYNSLVAKHVATRFRSLAFGTSFAISLGLGSLGAVVAGRFQTDPPLFVSLAVVTFVGSLVATLLALFSFKIKSKQAQG